MRIISDYHTHTVYSHGKGTAEQNVCVAIEKGLKRIAISEHAGAHIAYGVRGGHLRALRREVDGLASRYARDIEVLFGLECNLTGFGRCDAPADRSAYDVLLLAYHRGVLPRDALGFSCMAEAAGLRRADPVQVANALLAAAERYKIDIFSHPGIYVRCDIPTLAAGAAQLGTALELNGMRLSLTDEQILQAAAAGAHLVINSDAHIPARVGEAEHALAAAERCGVSIDNAG